MSEPAARCGIAALASPAVDLAVTELKACCAAAYGHPAVRWLLGDELHPGGEATTRRALELADSAARRAPPRRRLRRGGLGAAGGARARCRGGRGRVRSRRRSREACEAAAAAGLGERVSFVRGDAEALPFDDGSFDVVLCECSLCTFPDKRARGRELAPGAAAGGQAGPLRRRRRGGAARAPARRGGDRSPASGRRFSLAATRSCSPAPA